MAEVALETTWKDRLVGEFEKPYMHQLKSFLKSQKGKIYPKGSQFFAALNHTPFDKVKVVILGVVNNGFYFMSSSHLRL